AYQRAGTYNIMIVLRDIASAGGIVGAQTTAFAQAQIIDSSLEASGDDFVALAGSRTAAIVVATAQDPNDATAAQDLTATINWGDGTISAGTVKADAQGGFDISGRHTYASPGHFHVVVQVSCDGSVVNAQATATVVDGLLTGRQLTQDSIQGNLVTIGEARVALNTGGLMISEPLDFDQSPGTSVEGDPA